MTRLILPFALTLLFSNPTVKTLSPQEASNLFHRLDFAMISDKPGAALAFRLKKDQKHRKVLLCFRQSCFQASSRWQFLATDPNIAGSQVLVLANRQSQWTSRRIHLEANLWEQAHQKIAQLRLPASVIKNLEDQSNEIAENTLEDQKLFSSSVQLPWSTQWVLPVHSKVTSEFGSLRVPPNGMPYVHTGVDLRALPNTPVRATSDGVVVGTDDEVIFGNVVSIDHGFGLLSRYMHLSSFNVNIGERVKAGDVIGLSGSSGRAEAPHLHWEMRVRGQPVDPLSTRRLLVRLSDLE